MNNNERKEVWSILNAISSFVSSINNRMGSKVCPKEQQEMIDKVGKALENMNFFKDTEVKNNE